MFKAYPVYDEGYESALKDIRTWLARFSNLQLVDRNGMHRYNNQDHSMPTMTITRKPTHARWPGRSRWCRGGFPCAMGRDSYLFLTA